MTNQQGAPEALPDPSPDQLRAIARYKIGYAADSWGTRSSTPSGIPDHAGAWVRYEDHLAALVEAQQPAAHVQNPAEIEHVAGNVSKNWPESNTARQAAPSAAEPCANCGEDKNRHNGLRCVSGAENAYFAPQADSTPAEGTWTPEMVAKMQAMAAALPRIGGEPAPQADSQPAPDERDDFEKVFPLPSGCIRVGTGYASTGYSNWTAHTHCERWQGWQARAARAPADSVTATAGGPLFTTPDADLNELLESAHYLHRPRANMDDGLLFLAALEKVTARLVPPAQAADSVLEDAARLEALHAAVTAIYLDDSSDFKSALGAVVRHLDPKLAGDLLAWPKRAFDISQARLDAARKQGANHD